MSMATLSVSNLDRLRESMNADGFPALLVSDIGNVQWLTGFSGSFGYVIVTPDAQVFITDSRYRVQAQTEVEGFEHHVFSSPTTGVQALAEVVQKLGITKLAFEPGVTFGTWDQWRQKLAGVDLVGCGETITLLRMIKTEDEIAKISAACRLADECFTHVLRMLQPGVSEYDIGLDIEFFFRRNGAGIAFAPIVASGPNSAKPHARPSERKLQAGDFLTLDFGCTVDGYNSDITRTVVIGEPSARQREIYDLVLKAQVAAVDALRPGASGKAVDGLARQILDEMDLSQYFGHSLGHGLGRAVHDAGGLTQSRDYSIKAGQVWTVEPGVYIDGWGGVRIEDDVVVTDGEPLILTHSPKHLMGL